MPILGSTTAFALSSFSGASRLGPALLVGAVVLLSYRLTDPHSDDAAFLPFMRALYPIVAPIMAFAMLLFLKGVSAVEGLLVSDVVLIGLVVGIASFLKRLSGGLVRSSRPAVRIGVVGSARTAFDLNAELRDSRSGGFVVVGYIPPTSPGKPQPDVPLIGRLGELATAVQEHRLDLLLVSPEISRLGFFDEIATTCLNLPVRVRELASFYETCLGHVPLAAINSAWFQWVVHPRFSPSTPAVKRSLDLLIAGLSALIFAPLLAVAGLLIRRDGGPVFYRQIRIGEGGQPFAMLKLRTMRPDVGNEWASATDDRVTRVGRFLRRAHLDELPQCINVLRGEMSIVGPRPEQPAFVQRLERSIPFYTRRHVVRPGITGWAQIQCGYAGSDAGSALKVCHDLYYLKHRSLALDLLILGETIRTFFRDAQWDEEHQRPRGFVHAVIGDGLAERAALSERGLGGEEAGTVSAPVLDTDWAVEQSA